VHGLVTSGVSPQALAQRPIGREQGKRWRLWCLGVLALYVGSTGLCTSAVRRADRARPVRIGALTESWGPTPSIVGLRDGLVELGYHEDADFVLGVRFTQGDRTALAVAAQELVAAGAALLFADANSTATAVQHVTTRIPIVFAAVEDPVGSGLVQSFAQPGGNITGVASLDIELGPKRLQLFQELVPALKRVLFLYDATDIYAQEAAASYREAARRLGLELVEQVVRTQEDVQTMLSHLRQRQVDGLLAPRCCALNISGFLLTAATEQRIPAMFATNVYWIERGALASFGSSTYVSGRQAARLVDKILRGAHPAQIPVEVNAKIQFTINLKTAEALGLAIAPDVLSQADQLFR
jgi:putative tryptophan/tyrosine transport system substrate-binding protein